MGRQEGEEEWSLLFLPGPFIGDGSSQMLVNQDRTFNRTQTLSSNLDVASDKIQKTFSFFFSEFYILTGWKSRQGGVYKTRIQSSTLLYYKMAIFDLLFPTCSSLCIMYGLHLKLGDSAVFLSENHHILNRNNY